MKKNLVYLFVVALFVELSFTSCDKDDNGGEKINPDNLFAGTWVKDDTGAVAVLTESTWTATYQGSLYNSGTYTYEDNTAQWKITNKGMGSANVGDTGSATISNNKMTVSSFSDVNMNGKYTKQKKDDDNKPNTVPEGGVLINGVVWAKCNVNAPGTFAANPEDTGMYYQWNRKTAWPVTGNVSNWDSDIPTGDTWEESNDPSPTGWHVPTLDEIKTLFVTNKVTSEWTTVNGITGRKFTDIATGNSIFLPAAGSRDNTTGRVYIAGTSGGYWSSTQYNSQDAYNLGFNSNYVYWNYHYFRSAGYCIRSVAN